MSTLIITNGDAAAEKMREGRINGEILCWRDVLAEGPVPQTGTLETSTTAGPERSGMLSLGVSGPCMAWRTSTQSEGGYISWLADVSADTILTIRTSIACASTAAS